MNNYPNSLFMLIVILHMRGLYKVSIEFPHETDSMVNSESILNGKHCEKSVRNVIHIYWTVLYFET